MAAKILIVDDEVHVRTLIEQTLEELADQGVEFLSADNGEDALKIIREQKPRLVFLDVMMPRMNGFFVCYTVKRELKIEDVTIVMLTAKGMDYDIERGEQAGADLYITKPFDPDELLALAQRVLS